MSKEEILDLTSNSSVEKAMKPSRAENKLYRIDGKLTKKEDISSIVRDGCEILTTAMNRPRTNREDLGEIKSRTFEYYEKCANEGRIPTMEGLAVALGIRRSTLYNWIGETKYLDVCEFLSIVRDSFAGISAQAAMDQKINPVTWIFYSKNMYGYTDKTELTVTPANPLGETKNPEEIRARLMEGVADDD